MTLMQNAPVQGSTCFTLAYIEEKREKSFFSKTTMSRALIFDMFFIILWTATKKWLHPMGYACFI